MKSLEDLTMALKKEENIHPNLLVVSGLQMMDNYPFKLGKCVERRLWLHGLSGYDVVFCGLVYYIPLQISDVT